MSRRLDHLNDPDGDALWAQAMATMATMGGDCLGPQLQVLWPDPWEIMGAYDSIFTPGNLSRRGHKGAQI